MMQRLPALYLLAALLLIAAATLPAAAQAEDASPDPDATGFLKVDYAEAPQTPFGALRWLPGRIFFADGAGYTAPHMLRVMPRGYDTPDKARDVEKKGDTKNALYTADLGRVKVQQTAYNHTGLARYTYADDAEGCYVFVDAASNNTSQWTSGQHVQSTSTPKPGDTALTGVSREWDEPWHNLLHWRLEFDQPIAAVDKVGGPEGSNEADFQYWRLRFEPVAVGSAPGKSTRTVHAKLGISWTNAENAALNMKTEVPDWDLVAVQRRVAKEWQDHLAAFQIVDAPDWLREHVMHNIEMSLHHPNVYSDVNGEFIGFDSELHTVRNPDEHVVYHMFSSWDTYRSHMPLVAMLWPEVASDIAQTFVYQAETGRGGYTKWSVGHRDRPFMEGDPSSIMIATAYSFGARDFEADAALDIMHHVGSTPGVEANPGWRARPRLEGYLLNGYISNNEPTEGAHDRATWSATLDYARTDFAISRMADQMGDETKAQRYLRQANNFVVLTDNDEAKKWKLPVSPGAKNPISVGDESRVFQYWYLPAHNMDAMVEALGGREWAEKKLDANMRDILPEEYISFTEADKKEEHFALWFLSDRDRSYAAWWNQVGIGHEMAYNWIGLPWKTQLTCRMAFLKKFSSPLDKSDPSKGYRYARPGSEDLGAMNSWSVYLTLGIFPSMLGEPGWSIGSPLIPETLLRVGADDEGREVTLRLIAHDASPENAFIQRATVNGEPFESTWLPMSLLKETSGGGENRVEFWMGPEPNKQWAADSPPPRFAAEPLYKDMKPEDIPARPEYGD